MKKFDFFLVLVAVCLIGIGYYFAREFSAETSSVSEESDLLQEQGVKSKKKKSPKLQDQNSSHREPSNSDTQSASARVTKNSADFHKKYVELKECLKTDTCDFSQEDPRAYEINVLRSLNEHLTDVSMLSADYLEKVLKDAARLSDGFIKKTVLKHLKEHGIYSPAWRDIVLEEFIGYHDAQLIPDAMEYLKNNSNAIDKVVIHNKFLEEISHGSPMVANALVENIKNLLDSSSIEYYKREVTSMQEGPIKESLQREIRDYELESTAG